MQRWRPAPAVLPPASLLCAVGWRWELTNLQNIMATHVSVIKELLLYLACSPSMGTQVILVFRACLLQGLILRGPLPQSLFEGANDVVSWQPLQLPPVQLPWCTVCSGSRSFSGKFLVSPSCYRNLQGSPFTVLCLPQIQCSPLSSTTDPCTPAGPPSLIALPGSEVSPWHGPLQ